MEVLYNKEKAIERKNCIDEEVAVKTHKRFVRFLLIVWGISAILASSAIFLLTSVLKYALSLAGNNIFLKIGIWICYFAVPAGFYLIADFVTEKRKGKIEENEYPPDVKYLIATENKTVFVRSVSEISSGIFLLSLRFQNESDTVSEIDVCQLKEEYRENITEDAVDLENGLYLVPTSKKEKAIAESVKEKEKDVFANVVPCKNEEKEKTEKAEDKVPGKAINTDALTIEQLKNLHLGEWVWIDILDPFLCDNLPGYYCKSTYRNDDRLFCCGYPAASAKKLCFLFKYGDYGVTWMAYENKQKKK